MREVQTFIWCDNTDAHDEERVPATVETMVGSEGREYTLDLCADCNQSLMETLALWASRGTPVRRGGGPSPKANNPPCPECGEQLPSRPSLVSHLRRQHAKSIKDFAI